MYSFARDGGLPRLFSRVDERFQSPILAVWLACFLAFCLALPSLGSAVAFSAATSIATIGLCECGVLGRRPDQANHLIGAGADISYGLPILLGLIYQKQFVKGPFHLGRFSRWVHNPRSSRFDSSLHEYG